ncbi:PTS-dependent dihydroxyacetone kinase phosphotransferase subunit DhaM [Phaeacidiphilus oryzae]|uniref:PTS-dependent dihydroxyacetone kinase phosphotransferase subunit DhaM n=1 Tax=Phaeacidiphilus oryzae TaxID=348818 RepID=UPI00055CB372|nr:PTS fructose transporter subunit IIA [Phaeacidiphilus oryzae]
MSSPTSPDRVGVVLVSHSGAVAAAVAEFAVALVGTGDPAPVVPAGGVEGGGLGTSSELVLAAAKRADQGQGVVLVADIGSAVLTAKTLLADADENGLPFPTRLANAPFLEGAVAATVTASAGGDLSAVIDAAEDAYRVQK